MDTNYINAMMVAGMQDAFSTFQKSEDMRYVRATLVTNDFMQSLFAGKLRFEIMDAAPQKIKLTLVVDDLAHFYDCCGSLLEKVFHPYALGLPNANLSTYVPVPPPFEITLYAGDSSPVEMSLDPTTMCWAVSAPYDSFMGLLQFLEDRCYATRAIARDLPEDDRSPREDDRGSSPEGSTCACCDHVDCDAVLEALQYLLKEDREAITALDSQGALALMGP